MLTQIPALDDEKLASLASVVKRFTFKHFLENARRRGWESTILVDDPRNPRVVAAHQGSNFMIFGDSGRFEPVMADLLVGNVEQPPAWKNPRFPDYEPQEGQDRRPAIFLNSCAVEVWEAGQRAGWQPAAEDADDHGYADSYYFEGAPRFAELVRHPCRLGEGLELKELLMQGIGYDPDGHYVELCLTNGPSFVCEVGGEPVCWSCTHLNGTMGMIYTPEKHRRKGYAKSLAAFQIDHMLSLEGFACCHVVNTNTASQAMLTKLGADKVEDRVCWRVLYWPDAID